MLNSQARDINKPSRLCDLTLLDFSLLELFEK